MKIDSTLQHDVMEELQWEPLLQASEVGVAADDGVVTLSGHLANYAMKMAAERAVKRVSGVKAVVNDIQVQALYGKVTDDEIAHAVVNAFKWHTEIPEDAVRAKVQDGWITLDGEVDWHYQKQAAENAVQHLLGVKGVTNVIRVKPRVTIEATKVKSKIIEALKRNAALEAERIEVEAEGDTVILRGKVHSWTEREEAKNAAWAAPGVSRVEDKLTVEDNFLEDN